MRSKNDNVIDAVILFADIIGSVEIANERSVKDYNDIVTQFHECARAAAAILKKAKLIEPSDYELTTRGDEACLILHSRTLEERKPPPDEELAITFAIALKLNWLASKYNVEDRMGEGLLPRDCAIGLHRGEVAFLKRRTDTDERSEGFAISMGKRVEEEARKGEYTRTFVTGEFKEKCRDLKLGLDFKPLKPCDLKGISQPVRLSELKDFPFLEYAKKAYVGLTPDVRAGSGQWQQVIKMAKSHREDVWLVRLAVFPFFSITEDTEESIKRMMKVLEIWEDCPEAHFNLGVHCDALRRFEDAVQEYKKAIRLKPDYWDAYYNLGIAYGHMGRWVDAAQEYKKAIQITPDFSEAHNNLAVAYAHLGQLEDAMQEQKEAIRLKPDNAIAHNSLGAVYGSLLRWVDAVQEYKEAIRLKPDLSEAHCNLGQAYLWQQRYYEAIAEYDEAIRFQPDFAGAYFERAVARFLLDDKAGAEADLARACELDATYKEKPWPPEEPKPPVE